MMKLIRSSFNIHESNIKPTLSRQEKEKQGTNMKVLFFALRGLGAGLF